MLFSTKSQIFAIAISVAVAVLLYLLPKNTDNQQVESVLKPTDIDQAIEMVRSGSDPMAGILKLREIATEDPDNVDAQFYLGVFSVQSGQFHKAVDRLNRVLSLDNSYSDAYLYLGHSYTGLGNKELAIDNFKKFITLSTDESLKNEVQQHIKELKNN